MVKPRWRWALFCAALWLSWRTRWDWAGRLMSWSVLPEWVHDGSPFDTSGKEPF